MSSQYEFCKVSLTHQSIVRRVLKYTVPREVSSCEYIQLCYLAKLYQYNTASKSIFWKHLYLQNYGSWKTLG